MPGSLQHKLQQFEVAPPSGIWDKISHRLDEEFVASDSQISETVDNISIVPPAGIWDKINSELQSEPASETQPAKVVPLYRRIAVAAIIIGLLVLGGLLFLNSNKSENNIVKTVPEKTAPPASVPEQQQPKAEKDNNALIADNGSSVAKSKRDITRPVPKPRINEDVTSISDNMPPAATDYAPKAEQAPLYDLQTVSALQPISVSAPPLRDKKGNIILDASLISNPDDEYITVTGPNGKQTKISSKFLSCLSYINASLNSNDADSRGIQCKTQFEEWRRKIIAQPAFIPTANNFFDIFELKDLLQEM
jgi:hypothetical protein